MNWCLITGLEGFLNGLDVGGLSDGLMSLYQQNTSTLPCVWSASQLSSGQSNSNQQVFTASSMMEGASSLLTGVSSVRTQHQSVMQDSCYPAAAALPVPSSCQSTALLSGASASAGLHAAGQRSLRSCQVELQPAETSSCAAVKRRPSAALELGNVHLRDLLSQDDDDEDDAEAKVASSAMLRSRDSPQEPQSTSCDDPPDSSTGNIHNNVSILKQLLTDSDNEEQDEVSACEPETTHNESHILLKVCLSPALIYA